MLSYKFILVGESGVGKSSLASALNGEQISQHHQVTIGVDYAAYLTSLHPGGPKIKIHLWDTAGQESFSSIIRSYFSTAVAAVLVFDLTSMHSFKRLDYWLTQLCTYLEPQHIMLVGNKNDREWDRQVDYELAEKYAREHGLAGYLETSALTGFMVPAVINKLAQEVYNYYQPIFEANPEAQVRGIHHLADTRQVNLAANRSSSAARLCEWLSRALGRG